MCPFHLLKKKVVILFLKSLPITKNLKVVRSFSLIPFRLWIKAWNEKCFAFTEATIGDKIVDRLTFSTSYYFNFVFRPTTPSPSKKQKQKRNRGTKQNKTKQCLSWFHEPLATYRERIACRRLYWLKTVLMSPRLYYFWNIQNNCV